MTGGMRAAASAGAAAAITWLTWLTVRDHSALAARYPLPVEAALWAAFAAGAWLILRTGPRRAIPIILLGGLAIQLAALSAPPRSSDDLYRYIWDGRVQAAGIDPYQYVPAGTQLTGLRDTFLWPATGPHCVTASQAAARPDAALSAGCTRINRPTVHTIYPPVAEAYFAGVYELSGGRGGAKPVQAAAAICALGTTILLLFGLRRIGRDPRLAVLWAWCPVVGLEAGNNAHIDVLAAFLVVAALLVLSRPGGRRRAIAGGALLGLAIATKITPAVVAPAVLRRHPVAVATSAAGAIGIVYLPHLIAVGGAVIGFLPGYLNEEGYSGGSRFELLNLITPQQWSAVAAAAVLAAASIAVLRFGDPARPWRGAVLMTGTALLVTTPFYGWYTLLLVALVAMDGRPEWLAVVAARYFTPAHPWPGVTLPGEVRVGYAAALAVVLAASLIRRRNQPPAAPNGQPEIRLDNVLRGRSPLDAVRQD